MKSQDIQQSPNQERSPMKWDEVRARVADAMNGDSFGKLERLLSDINAATLVMEDQQRRAESWEKIANFVATQSLLLLEKRCTS